MRAYREVEGRRVASVGEAVWHAPAGPYTYIRLELLEVAWNLGA